MSGIVRIIIAFIRNPIEFSTVTFLVSTVTCWYLILAAQLRVMLGTQDKWLKELRLQNVPTFRRLLEYVCSLLENIDMPALFIIMSITCVSIAAKGIYGLIRGKSAYLEAYLEYRIFWIWISSVIAILYFVIAAFSGSLDFTIFLILGGLAALDFVCWKVVSVQMERVRVKENKKVNNDGETLVPRTDADYIATSEGNIFRRNNFSNV